MYLFDTNIQSGVINNPKRAAPAKVSEVDEANVATSVVVTADLRFDAERRGSPRLTAQFDVRVASYGLCRSLVTSILNTVRSAPI